MAPLFKLAMIALLASAFSIAAAVPNDYADQSVLDRPVRIKSVRDRLLDSQIIPDVLYEFCPLVYLDLVYTTRSHAVVDLGNFIPPWVAYSKPTYSLDLASVAHHAPGIPYTIVLTDPDAPSRADASNGQFCHWIATNITSPHAADLVPYLPPTPPPGSGPHRYVFVLLRPRRGVEYVALKAPSERPRWGYGSAGEGVQRWADENGLEAVGANFFYAVDGK
ncbi:MAG: hypothetical protein M1832_002077 [Thelocarpon impressellum]|nr:MAG: hypothetical protein M1832_002077 [Thelocarpon impressellum]